MILAHKIAPDVTAVNLRERSIGILGACVGDKSSKDKSAETDKYPQLMGNQRLGIGRAVSGLVEPVTKPCAQLHTN